MVEVDPGVCLQCLYLVLAVGAGFVIPAALTELSFARGRFMAAI